MHWSEKYLGLPHIEGEFDCAALAEQVRREVFGHNLQLPSARRAGPFGRSGQIAEHLADYAVPTDTPQDGDGVLLVVKSRLQHIGLYCVIGGEAWVIHNMDGQGVTRRRVRDLDRWGMRIEGYYRWI